MHRFHAAGVALLLACLALPAAGRAQRIFPQQTGWTYSRTLGSGSVTSQLARTRAEARLPQVVVEPGNTELLIGADGNYDYRILDPTQKFGSAYQSQTLEETEITDTNAILTNTDFGYSVFNNN